MKNEKAYPQEILDLLSLADYDTLSDAQQQLVTEWVSEEEYRLLRKAYVLVGEAEQNMTAELRPLTGMKESLVSSMQHKHKRQASLSRITHYRMPMWQVAATIVLMIGVFFLTSGQKRSGALSMSGIVDTVKVVSTQIKTELVHDTVFLEKEKTGTGQRQSTAETKTVRTAKEMAYDSFAYAAPSSTGVRVLPPNEKHDITRYGKSVADDTLMHRFGFVTL